MMTVKMLISRIRIKNNFKLRIKYLKPIAKILKLKLVIPS